MADRRPQTGEIYRHFKDKLYQIVGVATHSETKEELVIYQALYGTYGIYARPLEMFVSEVDHEKYPQVKQKWRFEKVDLAQETKHTEAKQRESKQISAVAAEAEKQEPSSDSSDEWAGADPHLVAFLEADTYEAKYKVLKSMDNEITDRLVNDFAVVLDVVIPEGPLSDRFAQLKQCVATMCRYETTRLR
ncbi:MAG: DUF1653 domain-containing protein [Lachnospiraceae bacterium]|nr:DUF1653 domain-containing protein [Lachnospiraceae bacterium]